MSRYYSGPVSDHFDGERFFDPPRRAAKEPPGSAALALDRYWRGTRAKWPAWAPSPYADRPPARVEGAACRISYVGPRELSDADRGPQHSARSGLVAARLAVSLVGPKRVNDPGIAFADLPPIDVVLVSHGHYDHLDVDDAVAARGRASPARHHAARQRHHHAQSRSRRSRPRPTIGTTVSSSAPASR